MAARDHVWLYDRRHGASVKTIAIRSGMSARAVEQGIARARLLEMHRPAGGCSSMENGRHLVPLFPIGPYTPDSPCPHDGPLPKWSRFYCVVCDRSGSEMTADQVID